MKLNLLTLLPAALLVAFIGSPEVRAQSTPPGYVLALGFDQAAEFGNPGDVLNFSGTFSNVTANTVFLNSDSLTFSGPGTADDSPFLNGAPLTLDPMGTVDGNGNPTDSYSGSLFDITLNPDAAPGTYFGTFAILGGADANASDDLTADPNNVLDPFHQERFSVTVLAPAAVPEASTTISFGLLLMLGGLLIVAKRRTGRAGSERRPL